MKLIKYQKPAIEEICLLNDVARGESEPPPPSTPKHRDIWDKGKRQPGELPWDNWDEWEPEDDIQ
ncbi:hypothetical protein ACFLQV_02570 [Calditrichota bacterium]